MKTIVLTNQKGGVAKTTTAYAIAVGLYNLGSKILIVDADPQSNLAFTAGVEDTQTNTLYDVLKGSIKPADAVREIKPGLSIMFVGLQGTAADMELVSRPGREYMIREAIEGSGDYDYCIIDSAPALGLLTLNSLTAADIAIVPMSVEAYSLQGTEQLAGFIENIRKYTNPKLKVAGILLTRYNERLNITQALKGNVEKAAGILGTRVFDSKIRESVAVKETQLMRSDLYSEAPKATATLDYQAFVAELATKVLIYKIDEVIEDVEGKKHGNKKQKTT